MKNEKNKMNMKKLLAFLVLLVSVLFLISTVSAQEVVGCGGIQTEVDETLANFNPAIVVGDSILIRVEFRSAVNASDITVEVEIEGDKKDVNAETAPFDVESGQRYSKSLRLDVPFDLADELSDFVDLNVKISGSGYKSEKTYQLRIQRESYNADIMSISIPQTLNAGENFPVDIVLKNKGYNDLNDLFVTVRISALNLERTAFFGDLVALECDDRYDAIENYGVDIERKCNEDDRETTSGRVFVQLPYDAKSGVYALEVKVENGDVVESKTVQVFIKNAFSEGNFIVSGNQLLIVNPTNELVVYRLVPQTTSGVSVSLSESLVAVAAGSSKTVTVDATADVAGTYAYSISIFASDGSLVDTVNFSKTFEGKSATSPIVVLTVVLAIIFIVLLVVLIILIGKKPRKTEEFGESYY